MKAFKIALIFAFLACAKCFPAESIQHRQEIVKTTIKRSLIESGEEVKEGSRLVKETFYNITIDVKSENNGTHLKLSFDDFSHLVINLNETKPVEHLISVRIDNEEIERILDEEEKEKMEEHHKKHRKEHSHKKHEHESSEEDDCECEEEDGEEKWNHHKEHRKHSHEEEDDEEDDEEEDESSEEKHHDKKHKKEDEHDGKEKINKIKQFFIQIAKSKAKRSAN